MSPPDDEDRTAILARRAAFLTSTLSLLHCSPPADRVIAPSPSATSTAIASPVPTTSASARPTEPGSFADAIAAAPPRGAPEALPDDVREAARALERQLDALYGGVKALWDPAPNLCDAADPACKDAWRAIGQRLMAIRDETRGLDGGMCGRWGGMLGTLAKRRGDHQAFVEKLLDEVDERHARAAAKMSAAGEQEWRKIAANAKVVPPMPCLKCAPPTRQPRDGEATFADGEATPVKNSDDALGRLLADVRNNRVDGIEIVGHADPGEKGDLVALSKKRAEGIAAWLKAEGIPAARIHVLGLGAMLPVSREPADNRRVEFAFLRPPR